jgi:hypothetical protein
MGYISLVCQTLQKTCACHVSQRSLLGSNPTLSTTRRYNFPGIRDTKGTAQPPTILPPVLAARTYIVHDTAKKKKLHVHPPVGSCFSIDAPEIKRQKEPWNRKPIVMPACHDSVPARRAQSPSLHTHLSVFPNLFLPCRPSSPVHLSRMEAKACTKPVGYQKPK